MNQKAVIVAMVGSTATHKTVDPTWVLNSVCHEGWELVTGSFVFVEMGQESRDKFMSSGQNIAVKGRVVGYYLFGRCPANRSCDETKVPSGIAVGETPKPHSVDFARGLFQEGDFAGAADVLRQLSDGAQESGDRPRIENVEDTIRRMRTHLTGQELSDFDSVLGSRSA